ncbi:hypothetical protein TI39_contig4229g00018 [Zymoseptoria brevis]|uniref:Cytochrome p450 like protein n=1 Tax=Zymoseptoria brevis TaxID=1047168 RepID=A0A0F4G9H3_9PEZI|nr:hypothetical protein TI39_contig4229g00018 [Zymoseptoria brevis]
MPTRDAHLQFEAWAREYGDIYSLMLGTQTMIVLPSDEAVKELLDRNSGNFSNRLEMYVGQVLCSDNPRLLMMGYTPKWRTFRKMVHHLLNATVAPQYVPYQILENKQMLNDLLDTPNDFLKHIRRYSNALTTSMVFGWRTPTYEDDAVKQLFNGFSEFADINQTGVAALLDAFPLLRKLPETLLPVQKKAKELHKAKKEIKEDTIKHCFCVGMAEAQKKEGFSDAQAAYISGTLLEAGSDTTSSTLCAFVQAMLLYPEVQRHAQQQLDQVDGHQPQFSAPYPTPPPKPPLTKATTHPARSPNPHLFDPNRFKDDKLSLYDSASNPDPSKRDCFTFGAGRRICPGMHVAERSLFLGMARLLWAFSIKPAKDANGNEIVPQGQKFTQGFVCMPEEYPADIKPRSRERADIVRREWQMAESESLDHETKQWIASPI